MKLHLQIILLLITAFNQFVFCQIEDNEVHPEELLLKVSVQIEKVSFEEALKVIAEKGNIHFNYNKNRIPFNQIVSVSYKNTSLINILADLLEQTDTKLKILNNGQLVILPEEDNGDKSSIRGKVTDADTGEPLIGANIFLRETSMGTTTDNGGYFELEDITIGNYSLVVRYMGYRPEEVYDIVILGNTKIEMEFELEERPISLGAITVTPGSIAIMGSEPVFRQTLTKEQYQNITFAEDAYRAIRRLPGISSNDFSAKFIVRGGESDEILVTLDGVQLYEPFHMKDVMGGIFSIVDVQAIGGMELLMGGFTSEYGERISGVFNIKTIKPLAGETKISAGISFMNARLMSTGTFDDGNGSWLFSARRGYLDIVMDMVNESGEPYPEPIYFDLLGKVEYKIFDSHSLSLNILHAGDRMDFTDDDDDWAKTSYGNSYGWLTLNSFLSSKLFVRTVVSVGNVFNNKKGIGYFGNTGLMESDVKDVRNFRIAGIKQDWNWEVTDDYHLKWGFDYKTSNTAYDYNGLDGDIYYDGVNAWAVYDTTKINIEPDGSQFSLYVSNKLKVVDPLTVEVGFRYDQVSHTDESLLSPRVNAFYAIGKRTFIRGAWGVFNQPQGLNELRVNMGESLFNNAQLSKHYLLGFEHHFNNGLNLRIETYYKYNSNKKPDYRQFTSPPSIEMFPEVSYENLKIFFDHSVSKGIEVYLKYDTGGKISFWASYALASVEDYINKIEFENDVIDVNDKYPGVWDQRHTLYFDFNYRPNKNWLINFAWQYHTGWPYSVEFDRENLSDDEIYQTAKRKYLHSNFPAYHRFDLRINRYFYTSAGKISAFVEFVNLYSRDNVKSYEYNFERDRYGRTRFNKVIVPWLPFLPSIGVSWEYSF